jgi:hypothetical protein
MRPCEPVDKDSLLHAAVCHERAFLVGCTARRELWLALAGRNWRKTPACNGRRKRAVPDAEKRSKTVVVPRLWFHPILVSASAAPRLKRAARPSLTTGGLGGVAASAPVPRVPCGGRAWSRHAPPPCPVGNDRARLQNFLSLALHDHGSGGTADSAAGSPGNHHDHGAVATY